MNSSLSAVGAILLDRDGTINRERAEYVRSPEQFELLPGVTEAFALLGALGLPVVVVTNQSGIERGVLAEGDLARIHTHLGEIAQEQGLGIVDYFVCPHHPDMGCGCRKPKPGLLLQAIYRLGRSPAECLMIGDSVSDLQAAQSAGCPVMLVRTGRQGPELDSLLGMHGFETSDVTIIGDLRAAVELLANHHLRLASSQRQFNEVDNRSVLSVQRN